MLTREDRIRLVEEEARRREAARLPSPWWTMGELVSRDEIIAHAMDRLAGQEVVIIFGDGAGSRDPLWEIEPGPVRARVSAMKSEERGYGWAKIKNIYRCFKLATVQGVLSLEEARECEVLP